MTDRAFHQFLPHPRRSENVLLRQRIPYGMRQRVTVDVVTPIGARDAGPALAGTLMLSRTRASAGSPWQEPSWY